jgi:hypothetical protein
MDEYEIEIDGKTFEVSVPKGTPISEARAMLRRRVARESQVKPVTAEPPLSLDTLTPYRNRTDVTSGLLVPQSRASTVIGRTPDPMVEGVPGVKPSVIGPPVNRRIAGTSLADTPATARNYGRDRQEARIAKKRDEERQKRGKRAGAPQDRARQDLILERDILMNRLVKKYGGDAVNSGAAGIKALAL